MKLIDADALKKWIENWFMMNKYYHPYSRSGNIPTTELIDIIDRMPAVDSVEVVRCKDCAYYNVPNGMTDWCDVWGNITREDDFCSYAERRQDG